MAKVTAAPATVTMAAIFSLGNTSAHLPVSVQEWRNTHHQDHRCHQRHEDTIEIGRTHGDFAKI